MKITVSKFAGFCEGSKRAYEMTLESAKLKKDISILGDLLHNNDIIKKIKSIGVKKVDSIDDIDNGSLIITAHGAKKSIIDEATKKGLDVINTTCPKVIKVQMLVKKFYQDGLPIIIFGDKNHKEVIGINGWCNDEGIIIFDKNDIDNLDYDKLDNAVIVSQTTQKQQNFQEIVKILQDNIKNLRVFDTICDATINRQEEVQKIAKENKAVIIIGSKGSANSQKLFDIAYNINPNTFFIENAGEIKPEELIKYESIGITAGASTPSWIIEDVIIKIKKYDFKI